MASMFLEDGKTIVKFADDSGVISETKASAALDEGFKVTEPVVVLVDGGSASAAEILQLRCKNPQIYQLLVQKPLVKELYKM